MTNGTAGRMGKAYDSSGQTLDFTLLLSLSSPHSLTADGYSRATRGLTVHFLGIFEKTKPLSTQSFKDLSINTSTDASVERTITRGLYLGLNDAAQRDTVFDSLEVSYSRRARGDYMTAVTGDSGRRL